MLVPLKGCCLIDLDTSLHLGESPLKPEQSSWLPLPSLQDTSALDVLNIAYILENSMQAGLPGVNGLKS